MIIKKRKDTQKWGYEISFRGRRFRKSGWNTRDDAQKAGEELLGRLRREISMAERDPSLSLVEAVNGFMKYSARIGKSENRLRGLYSNFKSFVLPFFTAEKRLKDITHNDIETFIDHQMKRDISKTTINHYVTDLNALLNWAVKEELIDSNPMIRVVRKRIRPERVIKKGFTPEQIKVCESALEGEERLFFRVLLFTGARLKEALSISWDDVDYEAKEVILRGTKAEGALRVIAMSNGLYETLKALENYRIDTHWIFHHPDKSKILRRDRLFKKITNRTGIKITAKDLRNVFASTIAMGSEKTRPDVQTVSDLLGHTNLTTTKKYLYSLKANRRAAVSVLDDVFTEGNDTETNTKTKKDLEETSKSLNSWWRCRELNPGHYGYEPYALTI